MENRLGFLPGDLNQLFLNVESDMLEGDIELDVNIFLRKGIEKNSKYSFISAISSYLGITAGLT